MSLLSPYYRFLEAVLDGVESIKSFLYRLYKRQTVRETAGAFGSLTATYDEHDDNERRDVVVAFNQTDAWVVSSHITRKRRA